RALIADGWEEDVKSGATRAFRKGVGKRVVIHYHPKKTYGAKLLQALIKDIGWSEDDLKKLKLIKSSFRHS
ncbi:MAG: addiction module toxin, HicA family, partial [Acidimicrobiia bacterium]|nr:addiction module toxin, HicA family [Acidimicrobiia bacterium]